MLRTHTCGELRQENTGELVTLCGWVHNRRDLGGCIFVDLRDRYGLTQVAFDNNISEDALKGAENIRNEFVIQVTGKVTERVGDAKNSNLATGDIELQAESIEVLAESKTPPFEIEKETEVNEELRLKYRYLDLRRARMKRNTIARSLFIKFIRDYLQDRAFLEIETPILTKSSPEGARDYVVPSRVAPGSFYALPQSPQQYKQLLMVGGIDRYFQIARCLRDEDGRGDRQPEFTQLDLEMSFVDQKDLLELTEDLFKGAIEAVSHLSGKKEMVFSEWPRLDYNEVMLKYGTDRPDLRYGLEIQELSGLLEECDFQVFSKTIKEGGVVRAICAQGAAEKLNRSDLDKLEDFVKSHGAKGLAYIILKDGEIKSPIAKFLGEEMVGSIVEKVGAQDGDIIFFGAGTQFVVRASLGELRAELARKLDLIDENKLAFAFVLGFPLFEDDNTEGVWAPSHHMFTMPYPEDLPLLETDPGKARCLQHDLICNGYEVGGGSIRITDPAIQSKIFDLIGFDKKQSEEFAHMLEAFEYGVPPHGGIAPGLDRMLMCILGEPSIREVIVFPKTGDARDVMMSAPSGISEEQLQELHIKIVKP